MTGAVADAGKVVVYARVSWAGQKADLDRQVARVTTWATGQRLAVTRMVVDNDLVRDVTEILTTLCVRLYGCPVAANRARRAVDAATGPDGPE